MNEFVSIAVVGSVAAVAAIVYNLHNGISRPLSSAKVGEIYNFRYLQPAEGKAERYLVKVLESHTLTSEAIARLNAKSGYRRDDPNFMRTAHLVTGQSEDGTIRNFYAERAVDCRKFPIRNVINKIVGV